MPRENFSQRIRDKIAEAAGHQCSFPGCNRRTVGPGPTSEFVSRSGFAAHIYAASSGGPRGQGGLSASELKAAGNGIWLCGRHAKLVDNNRGTSYPAETLLSYKALHEARVLLEHEGLYPPIGWLHELSIVQGPLFAAPQVVQLAKLNLIYGMNATGKTAITEWISAFFDCEKLRRWMPANDQPLKLRMTLLNPKLRNLDLTVTASDLAYAIDGAAVAFIPIGFRIFKPNRFDFSIPDDLVMLSHALGVPEPWVQSLIEEVNRFPHAKASNLRFEAVTDDEGNATAVRSLRSDVQGTAPGLTLRGLSGRESEGILLELVTAAARLSGRYCPTLLILDESISIIFDGFFEFYSHHLLDPLNQFQTLMCIAERNLDLDRVTWNGWQVIRTHGKPPNVTLSQDIRLGSETSDV
jgi:hypothetical protein